MDDSQLLVDHAAVGQRSPAGGTRMPTTEIEIQVANETYATGLIGFSRDTTYTLPASVRGRIVQIALTKSVAVKAISVAGVDIPGLGRGNVEIRGQDERSVKAHYWADFGTELKFTITAWVADGDGAEELQRMVARGPTMGEDPEHGFA